MRALIVDNSRAMRIMLGRFMKELGFETADAEHGKAALAKLESEPLPDLMLCDWNMPEMNGLDLVKAVRAEGKYASVKILMVTTETELSHVTRAIEAGANEYLMKPFMKESLQAKVEVLGLGSPA
ncbi:MAG: response regulator [Gemmatimonadales bacterium]